MTQLEEMLSETKDLVTVKKVYGEPYQSNGVTFIPAAAVRGGMGGGEGDGSESAPAGRGGGMGIAARPIGAYRIKGDDVAWVPAVDVSRVIFTGQIVAIVALLVIRSILSKRRKG
ncbi:MAG TPA: sporulation protein [Acidimicrobiia bacterium]|nr:sporulation protein [Acidimicrobiia bacterium]